METCIATFLASLLLYAGVVIVWRPGERPVIALPTAAIAAVTSARGAGGLVQQ